MRKSKNFFVDGTFHHPEFKQMLIIMYKDIITDLKIPGLYIIMNSKKEELYDFILSSIFNLLTKNNSINLDLETIVTDQEKALINSLKKFFPNTQPISCLFHYKQDILRNLRLYGLYKKEFKEESKNLIKALGKLPFKYKGDISVIYKFCEDYIKNNVIYKNFLNNYFLPNKIPYFNDNSLNYFNIPKDCRTNNFLENYNGYIKDKLGKYRTINWINFLNFIKEESSRSVLKLLNPIKDKNTFKASEFSKHNILINKLNLEDKNENITKKDDKKYNNNNNNNYNQNNDKYLEAIDIKTLINKKLGIKNEGNTCYINSFIQILIHLEEFIDKFIKTINKNANNNALLVDKFYSILILYLNTEDKANSYIEISDIY